MVSLIALVCSVAMAADPAPTDLLSSFSVGAGQKQVVEGLKKLGATDIEKHRFDQPGAFAAGVMTGPGMLAMVNRADVDSPLFADLPKKGPTFVTARIGGTDASYAFVGGKLWGMSVALPYRKVKPTAEPFASDRLAPLETAIGSVCNSRQVAGKDEYNNAIAWKSQSCRGGVAHIWYDPTDRDAALKMLVHRR